MTAKSITAKTTTEDGKKLGPVTVKFDLGATTTEKVSKFGEEATNMNAESSMIVSIQDAIRACLRDGLDQKATQKKIDDWKPGVKRRTKTKAEKMREAYEQLSPEEKKELLDNLTS